MDETIILCALASATALCIMATLLLVLLIIDRIWRWWWKRRMFQQIDPKWNEEMQARFDEFVGKR